MRTQGGYRFSLQFAAESEEQIRAGEFLERMGNRKSAIVVNAISHYLDANPELSASNTEVKIQVNSPVKKNEIEALIRSIIEERLGAIPSVSAVTDSLPSVQESLEADITSMLGNIAMFG